MAWRERFQEEALQASACPFRLGGQMKETRPSLSSPLPRAAGPCLSVTTPFPPMQGTCWEVSWELLAVPG